MGIAYLHDGATGLSVSVWDGEISTDERQRHMALLASDPVWGAGGLLLTDLAGVSSASCPAPENLLDAAVFFLQRLGCQARYAKWAIVANSTFAHALQFGSHIETEVRRMIVFNDRATACAWLGVNTADVRQIVDELRREIRSSDSHVL